MTTPTCPPGAFVVITSGAKAKFFRNEGTARDIKLKHVGDQSPQNLDNEGPSGNRPPESSQQETDEATFAKQLAQHLYTKAHRGDFDHLVLVADPARWAKSDQSFIRRSLRRSLLKWQKL